MNQLDDIHDDRSSSMGGGAASAESAESNPAPALPLNRWAIAAFVCAGLSFSFLPVVGTILGFVFAKRAEDAIRAQPERYRGLVEVLWARRLAWLGVVIISVSAIAVGFAWWGMNG